MPEVHPLVRKLIPLPAQVRNHLHQVAKKQARLGVRMFLFGSVARTWPQAHIGADLDIGYEIDGNRIDRADRLDREQGLESNGPRQAFENAFRLGWIDDEVLWNDAIKARNLAIHVYREIFAIELAAELPRLHAGFEGLITRLPPLT